jgi:hypothetical protein
MLIKARKRHLIKCFKFTDGNAIIELCAINKEAAQKKLEDIVSDIQNWKLCN